VFQGAEYIHCGLVNEQQIGVRTSYVFIQHTQRLDSSQSVLLWPYCYVWVYFSA